MSVNPKYHYDAEGNLESVELSVAEWTAIAAQLPKEMLSEDLPLWQQELLRERLTEIDRRQRAGMPDSAIDAAVLIQELQSLDEHEAEARR